MPINSETNTITHHAAIGRFNGQATVSAFLDGRPLLVSVNTVQDYFWTNRWSTMMEVTPGAHQLTVSALHPSGLFSTNASAWFTNNTTREVAQVYRDGAGNIAQRIWYAPDGSICRNESLMWDQKERLEVMLVDEDGHGNGFEWFAYYDGLDRLAYTAWYRLTNSVQGDYQLGVPAQTNRFVYDPQVQFLDLGAYVGPCAQDSMPGQMAWKLCGPDLNGRYGGVNGAGGLEATANGVGYFSPTVSDARGNVLGACDPEHGSVTWNASRPTGYGAVPGYRPLPLGHGGSYAQSAAWRGKWADVTGYIWLGARFYDPVAGMFISPDPVWNSQDPSYWSYCGGGPVNRFDANGLCAGVAAQATAHGIDATWNLGLATLFTPAADNPDQASALAQLAIDKSGLGSPMKNWFGVSYSASPVVDSAPATFGPLVQNAINSYGVGGLTARTPGLEVPAPDYSGPQTGFYVTPGGVAVPSTGYRAISGSAVTEAQGGTIESRNPSYLTFNDITGMSPEQVQNLLQLPRTPTHVATFDTLQILNDMGIPTTKWNTGTEPEPFAVSNPQWGTGGGSQAITYSIIQSFYLASLSRVNAPPATITTTVPIAR